VRTADAAVNYYLGIAMVLAAGLDGIEQKLIRANPQRRHLQDGPEELRGIALPATFEQSLAEFESTTWRSAPSARTSIRRSSSTSRECHEYRSVVTDWESTRYLQRI
jgi:glutamine synthetase